MSLSTAPNVKNNHTLAEKHYISLEKVLDQIWKSFNINFRPQWKVRKSSYGARQFLALSCNSAVLIWGKNHRVKDLRPKKMSNNSSLKMPRASYKHKTAFRDNYGQNNWDKLYISYQIVH